MRHAAPRGGALRPAARLVVVAGLLATVLGPLSLVAQPASAATSARQEMLALTNRSRAAHGVQGLKLNSRLSNAATRHSRSMASKGTIFHTANVPRELRHWHWSSWGENVGMTSGSLSDLQDAFMNSTVHRQNILNRRFKHVGIGVARDGDAYWVTVVFYG